MGAPVSAILICRSSGLTICLSVYLSIYLSLGFLPGLHVDRAQVSGLLPGGLRGDPVQRELGRNRPPLVAPRPHAAGGARGRRIAQGGLRPVPLRRRPSPRRFLRHRGLQGTAVTALSCSPSLPFHFTAEYEEDGWRGSPPNARRCGGTGGS